MFIFIIYPNLVWKMLPNFRCDLAIGHLVHGFNRKDMTLESFMLKTLFQLAFCLTRAKYLDGFCITNSRNDLVVVCVEYVPKFSVPLVL